MGFNCVCHSLYHWDEMLNQQTLMSVSIELGKYKVTIKLANESNLILGGVRLGIVKNLIYHFNWQVSPLPVIIHTKIRRS